MKEKHNPIKVGHVKTSFESIGGDHENHRNHEAFQGKEEYSGDIHGVTKHHIGPPKMFSGGKKGESTESKGSSPKGKDLSEKKNK